MTFKCFFVSIIIVFIAIIFSCQDKENVENKNVKIKESVENQDFHYSSIKILKGYAIPDTNTAVKIAEAVWLARFGDHIIEQRPYNVSLEIGKDTIWHIVGSAHNNSDTNMITFGGLVYISLRSRDCCILELYRME